MHIFNRDGAFISGIVLEVPPERPCEVEILASNERVPKNWTKVLFESEFSGQERTYQFRRPLNDTHFKIDCLPNIEGIEGKISLSPYVGISRNLITEELRKKTIIFIGCARDCLEGARKTIEVLKNLGHFFTDFKIAIYENDSTDGTDEYLRSLAEINDIVLFQKPLLIDFPNRTARLSYCRNELLNYAKKTGSDYVCVCDLDGVIGSKFDYDGFLSNFELNAAWDAVFPINKGIYYDIWALRHPVLCPFDYEREMNLAPISLGAKNTIDLYLHQRQRLDLSMLSSWLPVDSAFGGMGLYKTEALRFANYFGTRDGHQFCEHVSLHQCMNSLGAKLYLNPKFVVNGIN